MKITEYLILAIVGIGTVVYNLLGTKIEKIVPKDVARETILSLIFSTAIIPGLCEYFKFSFLTAVALTGLVGLFIKIIMKKLETKIEDKIDEL
jgi:predicted MFS family arabinose efflux permease